MLISLEEQFLQLLLLYQLLLRNNQLLFTYIWLNNDNDKTKTGTGEIISMTHYLLVILKNFFLTGLIIPTAEVSENKTVQGREAHLFLSIMYTEAIKHNQGKTTVECCYCSL